MSGQKQGSTLTSFTLKFIATDGDVESEDKMIIEAQDESHARVYFDG